jgi:nucleotide-binding universal stress UspA family protein
MTTRTRTRRRHPSTRAAKPVPAPPLVVPRVVVATDASDAAAAAVRFARRMETRGDWAPEAVTVLEPIPVAMAEVAFAVPSDQYVQLAHDSVVARIRRQIKRLGAGDWKLDIRFGRVPPTIVDVARERKADVLVLGLGKHGKLARLFGAETVARVARRVGIPVLAVSPETRPPMRAAVVAIDFGSSSIRAAREALLLLEPPARLHLLHVRWAFEGNTLRPAEWERTYADGVELGFARLIDDLGHHPGIRMTSELRLGNIVETTLAVAKRIDADLIAAGSHNEDVVERLLVGSTPAHLLRAADCSVLLAPPSQE